jgi:Uncharacterized protein conserved in bacteria
MLFFKLSNKGKIAVNIGAISLSACASASPPGAVEIDNSISGCIKISNYSLAQKNDPVILSLKSAAALPDADCPCKSSLIRYSAYQTIEGQKSTLLESSFSILGITQIELPIATQQKLIFKDAPVAVSFSCANGR